MRSPAFSLTIVYVAACAGCEAQYAAAPPATSVAARDDASPPLAHAKDEYVTLKLQLSDATTSPGKEVEVRLSIEVAPRWEIGGLAIVPPAAATRIALELPEQLKAAGEWNAPPPGRSMSPDAHPAYSGNVQFSRKLIVRQHAPAGESAVRCRVTYQVCDDRQCLQPAPLELSVPLRIE